MEKIKEALKDLFDDKVDDGGLDKIIEMIEIKIAAKATEKLDESIVTAVENKEAELTESNKKDLNEYKTTLADTIEKYLEMAMDEFVQENKENIESNVMVEMAEAFMGGITTMMKEHNIKIDDSDVNVIADLENKVIDLENRVETRIDESIEANKQSIEYQKALAILAKTSDCTLSQREKVISFMEALDYSNMETFEHKLDTVINEVIKPSSSTGINPDDFDEIPLNESTSKTHNSRKTKPTRKTKADKLLEDI